MVNGIFFPLSYLLLLVCKNFYALILYTAALPDSLIGSSVFLLASLGFSVYSFMSSADSDTFASSSPVWIPFISFSCQIAMARTYKTMLNNSGESGYPCLIPDLRGNAFSFSPLRMMFAVGFSHTTFIEVDSLYAYFLEDFYHK